MINNFINQDIIEVSYLDVFSVDIKETTLFLYLEKMIMIYQTIKLYLPFHQIS